MVLAKSKRSQIIEDFKIHVKDTGSPVVQIALLTEKIKQLSVHLKSFTKDHHSRRGLLMMIGKRRRLLSYLKKTDPQKYEALLQKLDLRK